MQHVMYEALGFENHPYLPMNKPCLPTCCRVRGCQGSVEMKDVKGTSILQCESQANHKAWIVQTESGIEWQFATRGRSNVKGTVVESVLGSR